MAVSQPTSPPFTRTDIYALNAIKSQFLGEGGGAEVDNALFLDSLRAKLGAKKAGDQAFEDLRARNDPEASYTTSKPRPNQTDGQRDHPKGLVRLQARAASRTRSSACPAPRRAQGDRAASVGKRQWPRTS